MVDLFMRFDAYKCFGDCWSSVDSPWWQGKAIEDTRLALVSMKLSISCHAIVDLN